MLLLLLCILQKLAPLGDVGDSSELSRQQPRWVCAAWAKKWTPSFLFLLPFAEMQLVTRVRQRQLNCLFFALLSWTHS